MTVTLVKRTDLIDDHTAADYNLLIDAIQQLAGPHGFLLNGYFQPTVASNNLTVAVKTLSGADPSTSNPVACRISGNVRLITAALSVTVNAATNTFNAGSDELKTQVIQLFTYLSWKAASSSVELLISRIPSATLYSDFSATATDEKYAAFSSAPASTDEVVNIGRFNATLSGGAGYTWTVPTFNASNLIHRPIYTTDWLTWLPTVGGYSANPTGTSYQYKLDLKTMICALNETANGTSNNTVTTYTLPFKASVFAQATIDSPVDNSAGVAAGICQVAAANNTLNCYKQGFAAWTNSASKRINHIALMCQV